VALLLLMTGPCSAGFLGPLLNYALALRNGMQLVGYAAVRHRRNLLRHGAPIAHDHQERDISASWGKFPVRRHDCAG